MNATFLSINTNSSQTLPKMEKKRRMLSNSFYEASISSILEPDKDTVREGDYRPISLTNAETNILNKIIANEFQQHIKRITHHDQMGFISDARMVQHV